MFIAFGWGERAACQMDSAVADRHNNSDVPKKSLHGKLHVQLGCMYLTKCEIRAQDKVWLLLRLTLAGNPPMQPMCTVAVENPQLNSMYCKVDPNKSL